MSFFDELGKGFHAIKQVIDPEFISPLADQPAPQAPDPFVAKGFQKQPDGSYFKQMSDGSTFRVSSGSPANQSPQTQNQPQQIVPQQTIPTQDFAAAHPNIPYAHVITQSAQQYGVNPNILTGLLQHESMQFNPKYITGYHTDGSGRGIAAIDKRYHPEVTDEQAFDPNFAIPWAAQKISDLSKTYGGTYNALRAYNGGGAFDSPNPGYQGVPIAQRTKDYANRVMGFANGYNNGY